MSLALVPVRGLQLLSLPNEVLAMIRADEHLSAKDLGAMRLTNKELHAVTTDEFAARYFQDPFVMMLRDSLETLVEICKHPVFGPHVRKVQLLNNFFNPEAVGIFARNFLGAHLSADRTRLLSEKRQLQHLADLVAEQFVLVKSGIAFELLKKAFQTLGAYGRPVAIASQRFNPSSLPIGWTRTFRDICVDHIHWMLGVPEVLSTIKLLLKAARAATCVVPKLEAGVYCTTMGGSRLISRRELDASLLLGVQELSFEFQWRNRRESRSYHAYSNLISLLQIMPKDLKTLTVRSDAEITGDHAEPYSVRYSLLEGLCHEKFTNVQPCALETLRLDKLFLSQHNLLQFLDLQRVSLKILVIDEVYLYGEWDYVLSHVARVFSLEQFDLRKARRIIRTSRHHDISFSANTASWYTENCKVRGKESMRQNLDMFVELQKMDRQARQAETRVQAQRSKKQAVGPLRRSERIAKNKQSEDQKQEE